MIREPTCFLLAEDELLARLHLEDPAPAFHEPRAHLDLLLDVLGQTGRTGKVVSLPTVLDGHFGKCHFLSPLLCPTGRL